LDPATITGLITVLTPIILGLIDAIWGGGGKKDFADVVKSFLENLAKYAGDIFNSGKPDGDNGDNGDNGNGKGVCYIAHGTYGNTADLTKFYVVRNSLPKCIVNGYYRIGPFLNKHKPSRITFLPFLEAVKGVMQ